MFLTSGGDDDEANDAFESLVNATFNRNAASEEG